MLHWIHLAWAGFKLTTSVVIDTYCKGSSKSNYHTITITTTTTTTPENVKDLNLMCIITFSKWGLNRYSYDEGPDINRYSSLKDKGPDSLYLLHKFISYILVKYMSKHCKLNFTKFNHNKSSHIKCLVSFNLRS
jgi:hypothetical protein